LGVTLRSKLLILSTLGIIGVAVFSFIAVKAFKATTKNSNKAKTIAIKLVEKPQADPKPTIDVCHNAYTVFCSKKGIARDPTGVVKKDLLGELQALRTYEEIIHETPGLSADEVDEELVKRIYTPERTRRIRSAYEWARFSIQKIINAQHGDILSKTEKRTLKKVLETTPLELPPPASVYADEPDLLTKNDVFYERFENGTRRLRVGGAYLLTVKSWFNMVFTLAHELAHTIDPCELKAQNIEVKAYKSLAECFIETDLTAKPDPEKECQENDHLSEAFADWMAVQVAAVTLKKYSTEFDRAQLMNAAINTVRDLCEEEEILEFDTVSHPSSKVRIQNIFAENPVVRTVLGCSIKNSENRYCSFDWKGKN